jgi:hypothetical protein
VELVGIYSGINGGDMIKQGMGIGMISVVEHRDSQGRLIAVQKAPDKWPAYQMWRAKWCEAHRKAWTVGGFREGKINPLTLGFAILIRLGGLKWH